jgi:hypothetical protein
LSGAGIHHIEEKGNSYPFIPKFTLHPDSYDWEFVTARGEPFEDRGTGQCVP